ncbi:NADH:flavin oxidoreductase/NADH oxidase [Mycena sanguinolenta]|nr:NADH:flavin oxidoreductase/NADH oxidase [Mycena sanguinolenta]
MATSKLFQPVLVGDIELSHRIVYAPTTRLRADANHVPLPLVAEYYQQRASTPGSLLISEATFIAPQAGFHVADAVHAKGAYMYLQLWALGRSAEIDVLTAEGLQNEYVSASDVPIPGRQPPRALTEEKIQEYVQLYATAAPNAVHKAGFDGVEIHAANGFLLTQFLHDRSNLRTDAYGGSAENRARFPLEVAEAVVKTVGQKKTAVRISPWGTYNDMYFEHPKPTYTYFVTQLRDRYPELAYLHVAEPRADGLETTAIAAAEEKGDLIAFSRPYIANPDLPYRLLNNIALAVGNRSLYYAPGSVDPKGYTDYPFAAPVQA